MFSLRLLVMDFADRDVEKALPDGRLVESTCPENVAAMFSLADLQPGYQLREPARPSIIPIIE